MSPQGIQRCFSIWITSKMSSPGRAWSILSPRAEVEVAREDLVATVTARLTLNPEVDWTRHVHCTVTKYMKWSEEKESIAQNDSAIFQQVCFVPPSSRKLGLRKIGSLVSTPQLMKCNSLKIPVRLLSKGFCAYKLNLVCKPYLYESLGTCHPMHLRKSRIIIQ